MDHSDHPEYEHEQNVLDRTLTDLQGELKTLAKSPVAAGDNYAAIQISRTLGLTRKAREDSAKSPYFARVDYLEEPDAAQTIYVGRHGFETSVCRVVSWQAPAAELFYGTSDEDQVIRGPRRQIPVRLLLKRRLDIRDSQLWKILDELDRRDGRQEIASINAVQAALIQKLYSRGDPRLRDIVETIQHQQNRLIRAPADQVLIINGVAGSGKTSIGYHRLSYLLSPANQLDLKLEPKRVIFIGPNPYFIAYARAVLPGLELEQIRHVTYPEWAMKQIGFTVDGEEGPRQYRLLDRTLRKMLSHQSSPDERAAFVARARLKGSLRYAKLMERLAKEQRSVRAPKRALVLHSEIAGAPRVTLTPHEVADQVARTLKRRAPISTQRRRLTEALVDLAFSKLQQDGLRRYRKAEVVDDWKEPINSFIAKLWPAISLREAYFGLLANTQALHRNANRLLSDAEIELLAGSPRTPDRNVDIEDLPALHYLYLLTEGTSAVAEFDHMVIDEGQDLSPLQYKILRMYSRNGAMTILGDVAQAIHRYRGIAKWSEITRLLQVRTDQIINIRQSYRATREIVAFTNRVLGQMNVHQHRARPIDRSGEQPTMVRAQTKREMIALTATQVQALLAADYANIAVIAKGRRDRDEVSTALQSLGIAHELLQENEPSSISHVTVLSPFQAKGVEYEAVIVVNATESQYEPGNLLDPQLLYVAVTRALHHLSVYYHGKPTVLLKPLVKKYEVDRDAVPLPKELGRLRGGD